MPNRKSYQLVKIRTVADTAALDSLVAKLCAEVAEKLADEPLVAVVGIRAGGEVIARRLARCLEERRGAPIPLGFVDITLYRDDLNDLGYLPEVGSTEIDFPIDDVVVILADDVIFTGRTVRAALDELIDFGRPRAVRLLAIAERDGRELPIQADFVGLRVEPQPGEMVIVDLADDPGIHLFQRRDA